MHQVFVGDRDQGIHIARPGRGARTTPAGWYCWHQREWSGGNKGTTIEGSDQSGQLALMDYGPLLVSHEL
jgi:hypothetical protein